MRPMNSPDQSAAPPTNKEDWREKVHEIIFEADTPTGKLFDVLLLVSISLSVLAVVLESVPAVAERFGSQLVVIEWFFTILFTIEYILRLISVRRPAAYATSFFGVVDLLSVIPTYLSLFFPAGRAFSVVRALRLLRIFRIFKVARYVKEFDTLLLAISRTKAKITVFLFTILAIVLIMGTVMYVIEGPTHGFTSIPRSVYWAVVTVTTVGYGDLAPETSLGRAVAALAMVIGYSLIIIPTGVFSAELIHSKALVTTRACRNCSREGHDEDAVYCKNCASEL
jgi:voltage-gated potassium channel